MTIGAGELAQGPINRAALPEDGFTRVAIVNRGEAAMRFIRAAREYPDEGAQRVRSIALHTGTEHRAMFVREADEAVQIASSKMIPYLDYDELERALRGIQAEAAWVGWGFVAEQPAFAELCQRIGVVFIGPPPDVMRRLGDKIEAKLLAEEAGVPVGAWSRGPVETLKSAQSWARTIGYPLMVKAAAGGGGRGIRLVHQDEELKVAFDRARHESQNAFGDPTVFLERVVTGAHHVEVQIIADHYGEVWAPGVRDCTIQRRNQKVMEESSSMALDQEQEQRAVDMALRLAKMAGYRNAGTVEFLYESVERRLSFLEVNARLQVEHPTTEMTTGLDLVKLQIHVARGGHLQVNQPSVRGHAIEVRLNAEDPQQGFAAAPGPVEYLRWPSGPGVRVDTGVAQGDVVAPEYDSMIAKVLAWGQDRNEAIARLRRALSETTVLISGGTTNKAFLLDLLKLPEVIEGTVDTDWLDRVITSGDYVFPERSDVALVARAIGAHTAHVATERDLFYAAAARGRPLATHEIGRVVNLRLSGATHRITVLQTGPSRYRLLIEGHWIEAESDSISTHERRLTIGGRRFRTVSIVHRTESLVEVDGVPHRIFEDDGGTVRAPAPGVVVDVMVAPGDVVKVDAPVAVIESMKMETTIRSPAAGRVSEVLVAPNTQVDAGAPLVQLELTALTEDAPVAPAVDFGALVAADGEPDAVAEPSHRELEGLRALMLGFDFSAAEVRRLISNLETDRSMIPANLERVLGAELGILTTFADLCMLSRNRRIGGDEGEEAHNQREFFHAYLHTLDVERAGLPTSFKDKLRRALGHYGVHDLDLTPQLEENLYWMYLAQRRTSLQLPAVIAILRHLDRPDYVPPVLYDQFLDTLDRLIVATQLRYPVVGDLARSVRYRYFDQPLITANRERVTSDMRNTLAVMADPERASSDDESMRRLVECPVPLIELMVEFDHDEDPTKLHLLIEVLTRRYYQIRALDDVDAFKREGRRFVTGSFRAEQGAVRVVASVVTDQELMDADSALSMVAAEAVGPSASVVDLYVRWTSAPDRDMAERITSNVAGFDWPDSVYRVTVSASAGGANIHRFTFVRGDDGLSENLVLRNLHPMIAERLQLWRLARFDVTRLPSPDHVYLFRCVGRDRPTDERLVVLAEVRDLDPLFDASGSIAALPELERVLASCLDAIRRVQAERPPNRRLSLNRVLLYVWPTIDLPFGELVSMIRTLAPTTEGLGLEEVSLEGRAAGPDDGQLRNVVVRVSRPLGGKLDIAVSDPATTPIQPMDAYGQKVAQARQRGTVYPFELIPLLIRHGDAPIGAFVELDLDEEGRLVPVDRAYGQNTAALIVGKVTTPTVRYPEGMTRVVLFGDPTKALGSVAEPECRRIVAALDLAAEMQVPVEWFAVSSGAKISMESGTENMDWVSRALRRIVEFTQVGGEVNVVVAGINVGAQPYWNAEATMLMHTRGILVMTPDSAMVLTGKQALEYSGGVAADDNFGIGGYDTVMGPNGQAQYWAPHLDGAIDTLFAHYEHTYVAPGERFPRPARTTDPDDRDVRLSVQDIDGVEFRTVGEIFADETNPERKKPFDIRTLMRATIDQDHPPLERWAEMDGAETAVVFDAFVGGHSACVLGIESRPLVRRGLLPPDGPNQWFAGTLYPRSSKKLARAINAASGNRPLIVLANLSGFDGSPESLRSLQLEYGAEIGRAIVNFDGPIVFCVVSRYHGGAFVVFSATLNDGMEVVAIEGSFASVIGGPPAAAVVFTGEVNTQTAADQRVRELEQRIVAAAETDAPRLRAELERLRASVRTEKLGEVAEEFEKIHSIERAREVGSIHQIIPAWRLRPYLVEALGRSINRTHSGLGGGDADRS